MNPVTKSIGGPELPLFAGTFCEFSSRDSELASRHRPMSEHMYKTFAKGIPEIDDPIMRGATVRAGIAAIFDKADGGIRIANDVIPG